MARPMKANKDTFNSKLHIPGQKFPPVMYGLQGIMDIFHVSKATASRYANSFLKNALTKNGNVIVIDTFMALSCFGVLHPERFILD